MPDCCILHIAALVCMKLILIFAALLFCSPKPISIWPTAWLHSLHIILTLATLAKGRTNVELREQFVLADGVSQSMTPFKAKAQSPFRGDGTISLTGPISKVCILAQHNTFFCTTFSFFCFCTVSYSVTLTHLLLNLTFFLFLCSWLFHFRLSLGPLSLCPSADVHSLWLRLFLPATNIWSQLQDSCT